MAEDNENIELNVVSEPTGNAAEGNAQESANADAKPAAGKERPRGRRKKEPLNFGKTVVASMLGFMLAVVVVSTLLFGGTIFLMFSLFSGGDDAVKSDNSVLSVNLTVLYSDATPSELTAALSEQSAGFCDLLRAVDAACDDSGIKGLYLNFGDGGTLNWAQCDELRQSVQRFRQSGRPVVAYGNSFTQPSFYLATAANRVVMNPAGTVNLVGVAVESLYLKDLLDKLDVHIDLIRPNSNSFKSAGETYTRTNMSEAAREQTRSFAQQIWLRASDSIAAARGMDGDSLRGIAARLEGCLAVDMYDLGLVDTLAFDADALAWLEQSCGTKRLTSSVAYLEQKLSDNVIPAANTIAVVYAEGDVMGGTGEYMQQGIFAVNTCKAIDDAAADKSVKAIVLRVNTPGGAVTASEQIAAAVRRAREAKPVVVSMAATAASAGYEISSQASYIVTQPMTLTGSIGVFGVVPEVGTLLSKHLGVSSDTVLTEANAAATSILRPMTPTARFMLQRSVDTFYDAFCLRVAQGRGLEVEYVDSIARGRVWTGADAVRLGLADTLGTFGTALHIAAQKAGVTDYGIRQFPRQKEMMEEIMEMVDGADKQAEAHLTAKIPFYNDIMYWCEMEPLQARMDVSYRY